MGDLRSKEAQAVYDAYRAEGRLATCKLCEATPLRSFRHWAIVKNNFPYDKIATVHNMIIPKRHVTEREISQEEWVEYQKIKDEILHAEYEFLIEATNKKKTIPGHFHIHLIVAGA